MKFGERLSLGMMLNWRKKEKERRMKRREVERKREEKEYLFAVVFNIPDLSPRKRAFGRELVILLIDI